MKRCSVKKLMRRIELLPFGKLELKAFSLFSFSYCIYKVILSVKNCLAQTIVVSVKARKLNGEGWDGTEFEAAQDFSVEFSAVR